MHFNMWIFFIFCLSFASHYHVRAQYSNDYDMTTAQVIEVTTEGMYNWTVNGRWSSCEVDRKSRDRNCIGQRVRKVTTYTSRGGVVINTDKSFETVQCLLTYNIIDGDYTKWSRWEDCSKKCTGGPTYRYRYCNNPTPCNGGEDCANLGADTLTKNCGPVNGQWGSWENWGSCIMANSTSIYGTGTKERVRKCNEPEPQCNGDYCFGNSNDTGNCRNIPPCLTSKIFDEKFHKSDSPMIIYSSAQVEIYPLTKNKCSRTTIIYNYWNMYFVNTTTGNETETQVGVTLRQLKFKIKGWEYDVGLYRLYTKLGYPSDYTHWMDESMYIQIMHPPPHAFIVGAAGRTIGQGSIVFDARSVSYSLTNGPGNPAGLTFDWACLSFISKSLYKLLQLSIDSKKVFDDETGLEKKWYHSSLTNYISEQVAWIGASTLYQRVLYLKSFNTTCVAADKIYVNFTVMPSLSEETTTMADATTTVNLETSTSSTINQDLGYELIPLKNVYDIMYFSDMDNNTQPNRLKWDVTPLPDFTELVKNELFTFIDFFYGLNKTSFINDTLDFYPTLSESFLTLQSLSLLEGLDDLPPGADDAFFANLTIWLQAATEALAITKVAGPLLSKFDRYYQYIVLGAEIELIDFIGVDNFMRLQIDSSGACLLDFFATLFEGFFKFNQYNWYDMKIKEVFYMDWIKNVLLNASKCDFFTGYANGTSSLDVTSTDTSTGVGYLVNVRVEFKGSISYFVQHAQSITGNPQTLNIECRLNCMKKTALTSITSLRASCPSCTLDQLRESKFRWNMKNFSIYTREVVGNTQWQNWMISDVNTTKFVMKANVLEANTGYLVEAVMESSTGDISTGVWMMTTNFLPYDGFCEVEDGFWGEKKVTASSWKDEGFRTYTDRTLDWKEQLNFRVIQPSSDGSELMLNYGVETEAYIKVNPGEPELQYEVSIKVHIIDIFKDYAECVVNLGKIYPSHIHGDAPSVSTFMVEATQNIDYYWMSGNIKQTTMNVEVGSTPVEGLTMSTTTIFDINPGNWVNLGVEAGENGITTTKSFEELLDMFYYPETVTDSSNIVDKLLSFVEVLDLAANETDSGSTVNIAQIVNSIGTTVINKEFVNNSSASTAFNGNANLLGKIVSMAMNDNYLKYEDFISVSEGILRVLNNALEGILSESSAELPSSIDLYSVHEVIGDRQGFSAPTDADLTVMEKAFIASQIAKKNELDAELKNNVVKQEAPGLLQAILSLGKVLGVLNFRKQLPVYVKHQHINSTNVKKEMHELLNSGVSHGEVNIHFHQSNAVSTAEEDVQVTAYDHTPFAWDPESKYINSQTVTVSVGENNTNIIPNEIKLPNLNQTSTEKIVQLAFPADQTQSTLQVISYKMYWQNFQDSLLFSVRNALSYLQYTVYVLKNKEPTEENYDWKKSIDANDWMSTDEIKVMVTGGVYTKSTSVYISLYMSYTSSGPANTNSSSTNGTILISYYVVAVTTGCRVWDNANDKWDKTSCKVSNTSTISETVCECANPPGNSFATTFFVPPNTIDFGSVFSKFDLKNNAAVFATVISLLIVYVIICIWAIRQDKKDVNRWAISYLVDNSALDEYLYMVTVYTGLQRNAGTKSNINFIIVDGKDKRRTDLSKTVRQLDDENHNGFPLGSVRRFVMSTSKQIKDPSIIKIWHDNSGSGNDASWYLNKILLEDIQTQEKYVFLFNSWLSLDRDDGSIESVSPVHSKDDLKQFSFVFNENTRQYTTDSHLWISVAIRPEESNFTRLQRLACCLALLFLTMISNAMFYGQDNGKVISIGPLHMSLTSIYISFVSALIAAVPIIALTYLFKKATLQAPKALRKSEKITCTEVYSLLRYCFRYLAWGLVTLSVLLSGFFLILYSMEWGKSKSENWLLAFFLSFFEGLLIVDPLKILMLTTVSSWIFNNNNEDKTSNYNREELLWEAKRRALKYNLVDSFCKVKVPIKQKQVEKLKKRRKDKLMIERVFVQLLLYLVFLAVLYLISFSNRDPDWFYVKDHINHHVLELNQAMKGDSTLRFNQIKSTSDYYVWLGDTLIPFMFPRNDANGIPLIPNNRLFIQDLVNFRVGPLRLRQVRSMKEKCNVEVLKRTSCVYKYTIPGEDETNYCVGWENGPCARGQSVYNITHAAWTYISAVDVWGLPTTGHHNTYGGGGYISELAVNYNISKQILSDLYEYKWIDRKTRAVFTEFTLFNANNNVFIYVSLLCEFPETGGVLTSSSIKPFRPYQHTDTMGIFIFVCEIVVLVGMIILTGYKVISIRKRQISSWDFWNIQDILIILFFFICVIMYIGRWLMVNQTMDKFNENKNKFVNFSHIATWDELLNVFLAFVIFITTLRLMKVLSYSAVINQLGKILRIVAKDLFGCFIIFFIVYSALVMFGYLVFGRELETYKNMFVASTTLTNAMTGKNSINDLFSVDPILGRIYHFLFVFLLLWILFTMLIATLNVGITRVKQEQSKRSPYYGITNYLMDFLKDTIGVSFMTNNKTTRSKTEKADNTKTKQDEVVKDREKKKS